jgi:hypothetical protein
MRTNTTSGRGHSPLRSPISAPALLALSLTLASCVAPPPQPPAGAINPSRQVAATPASARASVEAKLRELGFTVRGDNDAALTIAAEHVGAPDPAWATCPLAVANDPNSEHNRRSTERPIGMRTTVVARFTRPGADTIVSVDVIHVGRYQNPYVALEFDEVCHTNGGLEHLLLAAAS